MKLAGAHLMKYSWREPGASPRLKYEYTKILPKTCVGATATTTQVEEVSYLQLCYDELRLF